MDLLSWRSTIGYVSESNLKKAQELGGQIVNEPSDNFSAEKNRQPLQQGIQTKKIKSPDGKIWDIPEHNVQAALDRGGQIVNEPSSDSWGQYGARRTKDILAGGVGGLIDTATSVYNIPAALSNASQELNKDNPFEIDHISGMPIQKSEGARAPLPLIPSATESIDKGIDTLTNDYTKTPEGEKTQQAAFRTAASIATPGGLAKGAANLGLKGVSKVLGAIGSTNPTSLAAAGAAGAATQEASDSGYGTAASIGAGLAAGAATGTALNLAKSFNTKIALAKLTGNSPKNINLEAIEAAEKAGLDIPHTVANESKGLAHVEQVISKAPYFGTKYAKKLDKSHQEYANKVQEAIKKVGESLVDSESPLDIGYMVKETLQDVKQSIINEKNNLYAQSKSFLPEDASFVPKHLAETIQDLRKGIRTLRPSSDEAFVIKYLDDLESGLFIGPGKHKVLMPVPVDMLVGSKVSINDIINWDVNASGAKQQLKRLQAALKEDLKEYGNKNPEWYKKFSEADQFYGNYLGDKALGSETVKKLLSQENPEKILSNLKDVSDFRNLGQTLGRDEAGQEFFQSIKREKLSDLISGKVINPKNDMVSYTGFSGAMENKQNKELIKYLAGDNYKLLQDLHHYAKAAIRHQARNPNPSGTAPTKLIYTMITGGVSGALAKGAVGGAVGLVGPLATAGVLGTGLSWLVSNNKALKWGIEAAKKQAAGNYKDAKVFGNRLEKSMIKDLGEDFVKQFVAISNNYNVDD